MACGAAAMAREGVASMKDCAQSQFLPQPLNK
jgi:hypothetical protein